MMDIVVIKIGSSIITTEAGLEEEKIAHIARDVSNIKDKGFAPVLVSSGAVSAGRVKLGLKGKLQGINLKQAAAAIGQSSLVWAYERAFSHRFNKQVAQVLLTRNVFSNRQRYINVRNTLLCLLDLNVIPIINENDTVSFDEIKFGDNDRLASLVAVSLEAKHLIILSDVGGLYTANPKKLPDAKLISKVDDINQEVLSLAKGAGSIFGTGGMYSKLIAARIATDHGVAVQIVNGRKDGILNDVFDGRSEGTYFTPKDKRYGQRKGWIASGIHARGALLIDEGAVQAVVNKCKSLLSSGIKGIEGNFERGDAVYVVCPDGNHAAKGLINYSSREMLKIMGKKSSDIEDILGYKYSDEVIHRDNMIVLVEKTKDTD
ncbi:MAG: glutamate 5-kinase [Candidatus Magnetoovum sp. WYHC-5]|nr:glutamate 5-kinase [Candidatus Magnetoovum sp. WYHC-5]